MRTLLLAAAVLIAASVPAVAGPYGTSPTCKAGVACPYPASTPKASYFETRYGTNDAPYSGWENNPNLSVGGGGVGGR